MTSPFLLPGPGVAWLTARLWQPDGDLAARLPVAKGRAGLGRPAIGAVPGLARSVEALGRAIELVAVLVYLVRLERLTRALPMARGRLPLHGVPR